MKMKQIGITGIIVGMFLIGLVGAIYPGEMITVEHNLGSDNLFYTIVDNSTQISALDVSVNSTHINITFPYDIAPDSFKIVLMEQQNNDVIKEVTVYSGGGGGTRTITKEVNNTIYLNDTRYYPIESECPLCNQEEEKISFPIEPPEVKKWRYWVLAILIGVVFCLGMNNIVKTINLKQKNKFNTIEKEEVRK